MKEISGFFLWSTVWFFSLLSLVVCYEMTTHLLQVRLFGHLKAKHQILFETETALAEMLRVQSLSQVPCNMMMKHPDDAMSAVFQDTACSFKFRGLVYRFVIESLGDYLKISVQKKGVCYATRQWQLTFLHPAFFVIQVRIAELSTKMACEEGERFIKPGIMSWRSREMREVFSQAL